MHLTVNEKHSQLKSQVLHKGYVKIEWNIMKRCNINKNCVSWVIKLHSLKMCYNKYP